MPVLSPEEQFILTQSDINGKLSDERFILHINDNKHELLKAGIFQLSKQEFLCLKLSSQRKTAKECAKIIGISHRTVEKYIDNIKYKLGFESKRDLIDIMDRNFKGYIYQLIKNVMNPKNHFSMHLTFNFTNL